MYPLGGRSHRCTRDSTEGSRIAHVPYIFDAGFVRGGDISRLSRRAVSAGAMVKRLVEPCPRLLPCRVASAGAMVGSMGQAIRYGRSLPAAMYRSYQS